ncbi:MAG: Auxin Efflux Carrier [Ramlibacter sp.]|nr:Auxin Efflux Carrier [Ramlibacter sp.]
MVVLIAVGFVTARRGWIRSSAVKDLSNLVFLVLTPALLFRTMSKVQVQQLDFRPVGAYFLAVIAIFAGTLLVCGFNRRAAVLALAASFGNTVMIGTPLVALAWGEAGLVTLFTLYTVHTTVLLTTATLVLELAVMREAAAAPDAPPRNVVTTVLTALRNALLHPVPLPIFAALLFAQTGWTLPSVIEQPLELLSNAFGPMALLLVGATLASTPLGGHWRGALALSGVKNLLHPLLVVLAGWLLGLSGLPLIVMVVVASLPIGANVFLFSQRYQVHEDLIAASVGLSTVLSLLTVSLVLAATAAL